MTAGETFEEMFYGGNEEERKRSREVNRNGKKREGRRVRS